MPSSFRRSRHDVGWPFHTIILWAHALASGLPLVVVQPIPCIACAWKYACPCGHALPDCRAPACILTTAPKLPRPAYGQGRTCLPRLCWIFRTRCMPRTCRSHEKKLNGYGLFQHYAFFRVPQLQQPFSLVRLQQPPICWKLKPQGNSTRRAWVCSRDANCTGARLCYTSGVCMLSCRSNLHKVWVLTRTFRGSDSPNIYPSS